MNKSNFIYLLFFTILLLCFQVAAAAAAENTFSGAVTETMDSGGYTYVQIDTGTEKVWAAGPKTSIKVGDKVTITRQMPMANYHSNSLNRDFDVLYFVGGFAGEDLGSPHNLAHQQLITNAKKVTVSVLYWYEKLPVSLRLNF